MYKIENGKNNFLLQVLDQRGFTVLLGFSANVLKNLYMSICILESTSFWFKECVTHKLTKAYSFGYLFSLLVFDTQNQVRYFFISYKNIIKM